MKQGKKIVGVVPVRLGSRRVQAKNLRMLAGRPLMSYVIDAMRQSATFDQIFVNSESELVGQVASRLGVDFYQRRPELATSASLIDDYLYDFICTVPCDVLAVVNPTSPFLTAEDINNAVEQFLSSGVDTQLCCQNVRTHSFVDGKPVNFSTDGQHPRSQDIPPVQALNFAITIWNAHAFRAQYEAKHHGVYTGKLGFFAVEGLSALDIDWEEDFRLAEMIMRHRDEFEHGKIEYDPVVQALIDAGEDTRT